MTCVRHVDIRQVSVHPPNAGLLDSEHFLSIFKLERFTTGNRVFSFVEDELLWQLGAPSIRQT